MNETSKPTPWRALPTNYDYTLIYERIVTLLLPCRDLDYTMRHFLCFDRGILIVACPQANSPDAGRGSQVDEIPLSE